jgi:hypothetical protein
MTKIVFFTNMRPDLSGALFLYLKKKAGAEGG